MFDKDKKMKKKRGFFTDVSYALSNKRVGFLIFVILSLSFVLAGDFVFQKGNIVVDTDVLFVNSSSDNVGIGTIAPTYKLQVQDNTTKSLNVSNTLFVDGNNGRVGIGTTTPGATLEVSSNSSGGSVAIFKKNNNFNNTQILINTPTNGSNWGLSAGAGVGGFAIFESGVATRLIIKNGGKVGIGTTTPNQNLHIVGNTNVTGTIYYGSLQANSPHMFESDESGYTRACWYDIKGYWNMVWFDDGVLQIEKNNQECNNKKIHLEEIETARENCEEQGLLLNEIDSSCYSSDKN